MSHGCPIHVEHGVKRRLNIRKHFLALDGIWEAEPAPSWEPPLWGQEGGCGGPQGELCVCHTATAGLSCIPSFLLNFNASSSFWQPSLLQPPRAQSPTPSDLKLGKKGTFPIFTVEPRQLPQRQLLPAKQHSGFWI